ncbi:MAG: MFS transporter, partial [Nonomuraea sp.]|nr:MFS transporter [Nonomuraea sp.]
SVVATEVVPPQKRGSAIALMFTGLTLANVLGVPLGTWLGQAFGWRSTFWLVAAIGVAGLIGVIALVPSLPRPTGSVLRELATFRKGAVWLALAMTVFGFAPVFAIITFISPIMTGVAGFSAGAVPVVMVLFGVGMVIGNLLGGRFADRAVMPSIYGSVAALTLVALVLALLARNQIAFVVLITLFGVAAMATATPLQTRVLDAASGAPVLASAANIGAFNLGNALGSFLAGLTIQAGFGYTAPAWTSVLLGVVGLGVAGLAGWQARRRRVVTPGLTRVPAATP